MTAGSVSGGSLGYRHGKCVFHEKGTRSSHVMIFGYALIFLVSMTGAMSSPLLDYRFEELDGTDIQGTLTSLSQDASGNKSSSSLEMRSRRKTLRVPICLPGMQRPCIQPHVTCNDTEVYSCYDNFTAEGFFNWLGIDVNNGNFSEERQGKVCRKLGPVSVCKANMYAKCLGDVKKYSLNEKAYRSQRDIFCRKGNLTAYLSEHMCLHGDEDYAKCMEERIANTSDAKAKTSKHAACETAASHLHCTNGTSKRCFKDDGTSMYRKVRLNEAGLAGCIKEHAPPRSSSNALCNCSSLLLIAAAALFVANKGLCGASWCTFEFK